MPLIDSADSARAIEVATDEVEEFQTIYQKFWLERMRAKLGFDHREGEDLDLVNDLLRVMDRQDIDFTVFFRRLADGARGDLGAVRALFNDPTAFNVWLKSWLARLEHEDGSALSRADAMDRVNPVYIPRNHKVQEALDAATNSDLEPFRHLMTVLAQPFDRLKGSDEYEDRAPDGFGPYRTFCGT